jgi:hypothetical protein
MSAMARPTPDGGLPRRRKTASSDVPDAREAVRRIATLVALALLISLVVGPFAGIVLFVTGLAALAAHAAAHPHRP